MWYESNAKLLAGYGERVMPRRYEWDARWWSPIINAEHLAMRERVGMVDLSAFAIFDVTGPGALDYMQKMAVSQMDVPVGRVAYTSLLNTAGGIKADLTIMRLGHDHFRSGDGRHGWRYARQEMVAYNADGSAQLADLTSAWTTVGYGRRWPVTGPSLHRTRSVSRHFSLCHLPVGRVWPGLERWRAFLMWVSWAGDLCTDGARGAAVGHPMGGRAKFGVAPVGIGVYGTTARLENVTATATGVGTGIQSPRTRGGHGPASVKPDFIGKEAYLKQRAEAPAAILCTLTVDDNTAKSGFKRHMMGREPILTPDGRPLEDKHGRRSYVTSAGSGPSVGKTILLSYLPPEYAKVGTKLAVEYFAEQYPVTVAVVSMPRCLTPKISG
ncbi:MAG: glycine cleavage T C-terminal barrel domain-containing protein [Anaerolineae bacterium]